MDTLQTCIQKGFPDDIGTYGLISGLFGSTLALGAFLGPSAGGLLFDTVGFRNGIYFVIVTATMTALLFVWLLVRTKKDLDRGDYKEIEYLAVQNRTIVSQEEVIIIVSNKYGSVEDEMLAVREPAGT